MPPTPVPVPVPPAAEGERTDPLAGPGQAAEVERRDRRAVIRHVGWSTAGTMGSRFGGAVAGVVAAHLLGPAGRGQYAVLIAVAIIAAAIASAGLQFWVVREVADPASQAPVRAVTARHLRIVGALVVLLALVTAPVLAAFGTATAPETFATAALVISTASALLVLAVLNGHRQMRGIALATTTGALAYLAVLGVQGALDRSSPALVTVAAAAGQVTVIAFCIASYRRLDRSHGPDLRGAHRAAVRFGWPAAVGEIMVMASLRADVILVAAMLGREEAGFYAVAVALTELMWIVPDGASQVVFPMAAAREPRRVTGRLIGQALVLQLVTGIGLVIVAPLAIRLLFGEAFEPAVEPLPLLVIAAFGLGAWKLIAADVVGRGNARARGASTVVGLVLMIASDFVLIPWLGLPGAALGAGLGYWSATAVVAVAWRATADAPRRPAPA